LDPRIKPRPAPACLVLWSEDDKVWMLKDDEDKEDPETTAPVSVKQVLGAASSE